MNAAESASPAVSGDVIAPVSVQRGEVKWTARSPQILTALEPLLKTADSFLTEKKSLLRDTVLVTLARLPASISGEQRWLLRRTNYGKRDARVRDLFRPSGPMRAFRRGLDFERAGLPTPRVLAAGIGRRWHLPAKGYLLVEEIQPAETLVEHLRSHGQIPGTAIRRVAQAVVRMHDRGFTHGDLTINNVLLDEQLLPWFIDLERARSRARPVNWSEAVEDFFRFARHVPTLGFAGRFAALRLVKHYCVGRGWAGRERNFALSVEARVRQKVKNNA